MEEFKTFTDSVLEKVDRLKKTTTLLEFTQVLEEIAPSLREWAEKFEAFRTEETDMIKEATEIGETFDSRMKEALAHQSTLKVSSSPAAGGKRWKMPRKMTRRYCRKTSCRKMGFTQKASCRPWKNCY